MYRIEVTRALLTEQEQQQFIREASRAGFSVTAIHNGFTLAVAGLTEKQAVVIRDELLANGIHSSIGVSQTNRE